MARNRKRAKERRDRQTQPVASGRGRERRVLDDDQGRREDSAEGLDYGREEREQRSQAFEDLGSAPVEADDGAPNPLEHAAPDAEFAEAQLATASRLEPLAASSAEEAVSDADQEFVEEELAPAEMEAAPGASVRAPAAPAPSSESAVAAPRRWLGARLLAFLEGSWRELQRVQWPDRRQVMQATGVVLGFVIVASAFLGVADLLSGKIVHFILNGHF